MADQSKPDLGFFTTGTLKATLETPRRILVIDGGGMRGLAPLLVIDAIMKELSTRNGRALLPCQVFDLICGTSVGGLISILIGRLGLDCQTAINIYETAVKKLFGEKGDAWKIIADGHLLDTSDFDAFFANIIAIKIFAVIRVRR